jgi:hypothetical protein
MSDMSQVIVPKSDQINADDLLSGPITIKLKTVNITGGKEQPVSMYFEGSDKAYRPCKSMCRVIVAAWGADASRYVGRSMTLYCDPKVKWGGMEVGGIRISHMSHLDAAMTMALTVTRANKKPYTVKPLATAQTKAAGTMMPESSGADEVATSSSPAATRITDEQAISLDARCSENGISVESLKKAAKVERLSMILAADFDRANGWITAAIERRKTDAAKAAAETV